MEKTSAVWKRQQNLDALLAGGIEAIAKLGVDNVKPIDVTTRANVSRQTFYSYFDNIDGMFAEIWIRYGKDWCQDLLSCDPMHKSGDKFAKDLSTALVDILAVSHRNLEVQEVVNPVLKNWFDSLTPDNESSKLSVAWQLALQLGIEISEPISPDIVLAERVLEVVKHAPQISGEKSPNTVAESTGVNGSAVIGAAFGSAVNDIEAQLLLACIDVVSRAGVKATSVKRLARFAKVSTGSIYPRFPSQNSLLMSAFDLLINGIVKSNLAVLGGQSHKADAFGESVVSSLAPSRNTWRNFRLEMHIAARVDCDLAKSMTPGFALTNKDICKALIDFGVSNENANALALSMQASAIGFSILHNAGIPVAAMDHRFMARHMAASVGIS